MEVDSKPEDLDALDREIMQKQIEIEALRLESDKASTERLHGSKNLLVNYKRIALF